MSTRADAGEGSFWPDATDDVALQRYRTLVDAVSDGVCQLGDDGSFVAVNDTLLDLTGYVRDELLGEHVSSVLETDDIERIEREIGGRYSSDGPSNEAFELTVRTADNLPRVAGDGSQLRQMFQNLLSNAIEYCSDEPPRIHVEADGRGRKWRIAVHDEGIGIDVDDQDRVFEVFERLHSREEHPGTGIGLALCQRIVERHGGEIRVDSEPGEGATFSFTLPAVVE